MLTRVLSRAQVRDVDRRAILDYGIPGMVLMENAGRGVVEILCRRGCRGPVIVCAGKGNNGGDGFVIARHLAIRGIAVTVVLCCPADALAGDALANYRILQRAGLPILNLGDDLSLAGLSVSLRTADWIVDALLGTGAAGPVREPFASVINVINQSGRPVIAVDLPSGMDCDTGQSSGPCIKAHITATFVAHKPGFDAQGAAELTGTVEVVDIGVPPRLLQEIQASAL